MNTDLLRSLMAIPSHQIETEISTKLEQVLRDYGFEVEKAEVEPGRWNLFGKKNAQPGKKSILFYGHQDTVAPLADWTNPYEPVVDGDKLIGLGGYDMKGGMVAFLDAARDTKAYVKVFLAIDEEIISKGAWHAIANNRSFFDDVELVLSAEPNFELGLEGLTRGRTGRAVFQVKFKGRAAHVARYKEAVDAIEMAAKWVTHLYEVRETLFTSPRTVALVRKFQAEAVGMSICADALLEVEVQAGSTDSFDDVKAKLYSLEKDNDRIEIELKPRVTPYLPGYFFDSFPHQEKIAVIIKASTGKEMKLHERSSVGDDNAIATLGIPVVTWGPDGGNAHNTGEWVSLSSLATLSEMYKKLLDQLE